MLYRAMLSFGLLALLFFCQSSAPAYAQIPPCLQGRMPFPTFAEEIQQLREQTPKPKVLIDSVEFEGVTAMPVEALDDLAAAIKQRQFDANSEWLNEIEGMARAVWQDRGYFQVKVTPAPRLVGIAEFTQRVALTIRVKEGAQFRLREIGIRNALVEFDDINQPLAFPPEELRKLIDLQDGEIFNTAKIRQGLEALRKVYGAKGYIDFTAAPVTDVDAKSGFVGLILELDEQKQFRVRRVETLGVEPRLAAIFKSRVKSGDIFNNDIIENFFREFKSVLPAGAAPANINIERDVHAGLLDIRLDLRPCPQPPKS